MEDPMSHENTNDFDELRRIVEYTDETPMRTQPVEIHDEDSMELDAKLSSVARAQQEAGLTLSNVVLR